MENDRPTEPMPAPQIIHTELGVLMGSLRRLLGGVGSLESGDPQLVLDLTRLTGRLADDLSQLYEVATALDLPVSVISTGNEAEEPETEQADAAGEIAAEPPDDSDNAGDDLGLAPESLSDPVGAAVLPDEPDIPPGAVDLSLPDRATGHLAKVEPVLVGGESPGDLSTGELASGIVSEAEPKPTLELTTHGLAIDTEANFYINGQPVTFQKNESPTALITLLRLMVEQTNSVPEAKNAKVGLPTWNKALDSSLGRTVDPEFFAAIKEDVEGTLMDMGYEGYKPTVILSSSTVGVHMSGVLVRDTETLDSFLQATVEGTPLIPAPPTPEGDNELTTTPIEWQLRLIEIEGRSRYCVLDSNHVLGLDGPAEAIMAALVEKVDVGLSRNDLLAQVVYNNKRLQPEAFEAGKKQIVDALRRLGLDNRLRIEMRDEFSNPTLKLLSGMPEEPPDFLDLIS